jgi:hypothetical protein
MLNYQRVLEGSLLVTNVTFICELEKVLQIAMKMKMAAAWSPEP